MLRHRTLERAAKHVGNVQANVEPDLIGKFDRPHRHAEIFRRAIDGFAFDAFIQHDEGLHQIRREGAIDQETGRTFNRRRQSVDAAEECMRCVQHVGSQPRRG